ncbi:MAG: hypothetical protein OHK0040_04780 [bacterium]
MANDYNVKLYIFYGSELFDFLGHSNVWNEILEYLSLWRKEIPELPEINFDFNAEHTFQEIKDLNPSVFRKLFSNDELLEEIIPILFPEKKTLKLLKDYFKSKTPSIYKNLAVILEKICS